MSNIAENFAAVKYCLFHPSCPTTITTTVSFGRCNYLDFHTLVYSSTILMFLNIQKKSDFLRPNVEGFEVELYHKRWLLLLFIFKSVDVLQSLY